MRKFNEYEKELIKHFIKNKKKLGGSDDQSAILDLDPSKIIRENMPATCACIEWNHVQKTVTFTCKKSEASQNQIITWFVDLLMFLSYLENAGFVHFLKISPKEGEEPLRKIFNKDKYEFINGELKEKMLDNSIGFGHFSAQSTLSLETLAEALERLTGSMAYPTPQLEILADNEFKLPEQLQLEEAQKQTKFARSSMRLSIVAVVCSIVLPYMCSTTINKSQIDSINSSIKEKKLPEVINVNVTNDTLKVDFETSIPIKK